MTLQIFHASRSDCRKPAFSRRPIEEDFTLCKSAGVIRMFFSMTLVMQCLILSCTLSVQVLVTVWMLHVPLHCGAAVPQLIFYDVWSMWRWLSSGWQDMSTDGDVSCALRKAALTVCRYISQFIATALFIYSFKAHSTHFSRAKYWTKKEHVWNGHGQGRPLRWQVEARCLL